MHCIVFITSLYLYYTYKFVLVEPTVFHEQILVVINVFTLLD